MATGNERPRAEPAKSKRSLTALGQSLRRGLTTRRTAKNSSGAASADHRSPSTQSHSDSSTNLRSAERLHNASSPSSHSTTTSTNSNTLPSSFAKSSAYTPSPLSRATVGPSGMGSGVSQTSSSVSSSLGMKGLHDSTSVYGTIRPHHRIGAGSMSQIGGILGSTNFRKSIYGIKGISGSSSGINNPSSNGKSGGASVNANGNTASVGSRASESSDSASRRVLAGARNDGSFDSSNDSAAYAKSRSSSVVMGSTSAIPVTTAWLGHHLTEPSSASNSLACGVSGIVNTDHASQGHNTTTASNNTSNAKPIGSNSAGTSNSVNGNTGNSNNNNNNNNNNSINSINNNSNNSNHNNNSNNGGAGNREFNALIHRGNSNTASNYTRTSGPNNLITREGYLSKKTDINPSTSLASALSRGWKVYRVVLKGAKLFFYKPPSESELRAMFPEEIAAAENESAGGYTRPSMSTVLEDGSGYGAGMPLTPGEVESGSREILFEPGVHDGQITEPLCDRYIFGECFTEVDLRSLKFKRYVCVLIFDDTLVVLKRRWVRQGLASSFFGAVSNKMRFGKGSRIKHNKHTNDNSSLVSAELGIQGKGYFTKWKYHASYPLQNAEAIEAASSRFSINHSPGMLGHLVHQSQTGSGRVSLYSIGNSSVSSVMTRTSTVSKDYSGAITSGVVPGFQIFIGGKERVARMFVATSSDAKNNWLSRFTAAKASYARRLRQRPRETTNGARRYNGALENNLRPTVSAGKSGVAATDLDTNAEDRGKQLKTGKDTQRTRLYWGTQRHPELIVLPSNGDSDGSSPLIVVGGTKSALVHEMIFGTTLPAQSQTLQIKDNADNDTVIVDPVIATPFALQFIGTYERFMTTDELMREFQRYSELITDDLNDYNTLCENTAQIVLVLAQTYQVGKFSAVDIDILRSIVSKTVVVNDSIRADVVADINESLDRIVPIEAAATTMTSAGSTNGSGSIIGNQTSPANISGKKNVDLVIDASLQVPVSGAGQGADLSPDPARQTEIQPTTPIRSPQSASSTTVNSPTTMSRMRSRTHHGEPDIAAIAQIPSVPELARIEVTGLTPSLLLKIPPHELAHQLYLFHKHFLDGFDPKVASLYMPKSTSKSKKQQQPTPSLLTAGTAADTSAAMPANMSTPEMCTSPISATGQSVSGPGIAGINGTLSPSYGDKGSDRYNCEDLHEIQCQLMVFSQNEPHFITKLIHHHLLVELPFNRPARRSALLQHWVKIGEACREIGDAVSWAAIAMAVTMSPIARLRETWHNVSLRWKELIVSKWIPLLIENGIYEAEMPFVSETVQSPFKPLIITPQKTASRAAYQYTPIPYYGSVRMEISRLGRELRDKFASVVEPKGSGEEPNDKQLFVNYGAMFSAASSAAKAIPDVFVEYVRSVPRSRAGSVSHAQEQQGVLEVDTDPSVLSHPYLQEYFTRLAHNPMQLGDELVDSDMSEYDLRYLLSISLQCEPSVADQYQQHLQDMEEEEAAAADGQLPTNSRSAASALRQAPGSILPLVCPETVPSTNILQWITPAAKMQVPSATAASATVRSSGRSGTISHMVPSSANTSSSFNGAASNTQLSDIDNNKVMTTTATKRKASEGPITYLSIQDIGSTNDVASTSSSSSPFGELTATSPVNDAQGLRHKRSRSFPTNVGSYSTNEEKRNGAMSPELRESAVITEESSNIGKTGAEAGAGSSSLAPSGFNSVSDTLFTGATLDAAHGDLSLKVLRVQYSQTQKGVHPVGFVVEVQGGTIPMLLDLLINGIEKHGSSLTGEKGIKVQLPDGSTPKLLLNRDVFQRTFMASFRHFCVGFDVLDAMKRILASIERQSWAKTSFVYSALLDTCENWLNQHFADFLDNAALREGIAEFISSLSAALNRAKPIISSEGDAGGSDWDELNERATTLLPAMVVQMLTPSGYSSLERVLDQRLKIATKRDNAAMACIISDSKENDDSNSNNTSTNTTSDYQILDMLNEAEPEVVLTSLNRLVQTYFARCSFNDWLVGFCLLEVQTHIALPWYPKKRLTQVPTEDDVVVSDIYQVLEQTCRLRTTQQSHNIGGTISSVSIGGVSSSSVEASLVRTMPGSIQAMLELHKLIRGWVIRQVADPNIVLSQRIQRIQRFLVMIKCSRRDSQLSASRVFGDLLNSYMKEAGMIPDRQPSYRATGLQRGYGTVSANGRTSENARRGKRKGGNNTAQVRYVPSFVERAVASALVSPESRSYTRAWNEVAVANNTKLDTLEAILRGARDRGSSTSGLGSGTQQQQKHSKQDAVGPETEGMDIDDGESIVTEAAMRRADCFVPCVGWLLENMISLCYDTSDMLVDDTRLVNFAKRHRIFIMLCVCGQLVRRCQDAFVAPTPIRISMSELTAYVARTTLLASDIASQSQRETCIPSIHSSNSDSANSSGNNLASASIVSSGALGISGSGSNVFTSSSSNLHSSSNLSNDGAYQRTDNPLRHYSSGFSKRSISNLRNNAASAGTGSVPDMRGYYSRKTGHAGSGIGHISNPDSQGSSQGGSNYHLYNSPPAPAPRALSPSDGSSGSHQSPLLAAGGGMGPMNQSNAFVQYLKPFSRLTTDEIEKIKQEIRERERLERELRDREQAIERQKQERTKILKRKLKEQQQRRAKNEPLLKMANLMNKVVGINTRDTTSDGLVLSSCGPGAAHSTASIMGGSNQRDSASSASKPRGPALPSAKPANVINLINSTIAVEEGYTKRDFVFRIVTEEGGQYLLQATDHEQMEEWINSMRDAATEAAARRLTLFVEEAKKKRTLTGDNTSGNGVTGSSTSMFAANTSSNDVIESAKVQTGESARSRFTAFLGGAAAFGGFGGGGQSQVPLIPSRTTSSAAGQGSGVSSINIKDAGANGEAKSFGVNLADLMPDPDVVPIIVEKCLSEIERRGLEEVGIYRVSGAAADVSRLRQLFNTVPKSIDLSADEFYDINVVSGVMKQFLRELPEPLMTYTLYEGFVNAASIDDYDERLWAIKDLVHALPTANYTVLKRLIEHLERVTDYEEINHMYGTNLALVFGPSLLRPPPGSSSFAIAMSNLGHAQSVIKNLILQYHWIFNVEEEAEPIEDAELSESAVESDAHLSTSEDQMIKVQENSIMSVEDTNTDGGRDVSMDNGMLVGTNNTLQSNNADMEDLSEKVDKLAM